MKKVTTARLSTFVLGSLGITSQAFAEGGGNYTSSGVVEFTPSEESTSPVDLTDPANPVSPIDPTDPEGSDPRTNDPLSIDYASSLDFGVQKITLRDQTYSAATRRYKTVGATGEVKEGPNHIQVTNNRRTETDQSSKVKQEGRFKPTSGKELTGAVITFRNGNIVAASDSDRPTGPATITLNSGDSQSDVMSAAKGNGTGTYLFDWGTDATTAAKSIELTVPGSTTKYAERYATKLAWALANAPRN